MNQIKKDKQLFENQQKMGKKGKSKHRHGSCGRCKNCKCNSSGK